MNMKTDELAFTRETIIKHRKKWIAALRSGEYKRGQNYLVKSTAAGEFRQHCCLGVVQCLAKTPVFNIDRDKEAEYYHVTFGVHGDLSSGHLTRDAMAWLGVNTHDPAPNLPAGHKRHGESFAALNDSGWTFPMIADAIEEYGFMPRHDLLRQG